MFLLVTNNDSVRSLLLMLFVKKSPFLQSLKLCSVGFSCSKAGIGEVFEGHQGPVTGINCHMAVGPIDFSHLFVTSSFDWTVKLWTTKVRIS